MVENFFDDINFYIFWENTDQAPEHNVHAVDYTHQQVRNGETFISTIDHFAGNAVLYNSVLEAGVIHSGENPSNHSPIFTKLDLGNIDITTEKSNNKKRIVWDKSSSEARNNYLTTLGDKLDLLDVPECAHC